MNRVRKEKASLVWALGICTLILAGCSGSTGGSSSAAPPPPEVDVTPVAQQTVQIYSEWVATLDGSVNAQIQPQVTGYIIRQNYSEGSYVRKGQILFEIDPRPLQAIVEQAKGELAQAESQVEQAGSMVVQAESEVAQMAAQLAKAEMDVARDTPLAKARAISQSQLDSEIKAQAMADAELKASKAKLATNKAGVTTAKAAVVASRAKLYQAELNLSFAEVRSLVDGIAGVAQMQIGNLVKPDIALTTVSKVDPLRVYFPVSEKEYLDLDISTRPGRAGSAANSLKTPSLDLILTNGETHPHKGRISFADRQVDPQTGTIRIAAVFPNPGNILRPGQFGRIRALTGEKKDALVVPQRAVTELQGSHQVAVVGPDNKVQIRKVTIGPTWESQYVIESGLKAGERVVVEGLAKAVDGGVVTPKAATAAAKKTGEGI